MCIYIYICIYTNIHTCVAAPDRYIEDDEGVVWLIKEGMRYKVDMDDPP